jgi:hypothetical protein
MKRIFTNNTFTGHYPVGTAAVVRAENKVEAAKLLNAELKRLGLPAKVPSSEMIEFAIEEHVSILCDGDY